LTLKIKKIQKINSNSNRIISDEELIIKYRNSHDPVFIGELFERYTHLVFGVCLKYLKNQEDSKDAVMQIFENLLDSFKKHQVRNFKSWLYQVVKNYCLMEIRRERADQHLKEEIKIKIDQEFMESVNEMHHNNEMDFNEKLKDMRNAIRQLSQEQGKCIELLYLHQKSYKEVVQITGYSMKQVKSYIQNGKRNLRNYLSSYNEK